MYKVILIFLLSVIFSCQPTSKEKENPLTSVSEEPDDPNQVYNFMGEKLPTKDLDPQTLKLREKNLVDAFFQFQDNPDSLALLIWYGRRLAYLGKYVEAIQTYSDGLKLFPDSYHLRRHRGHRYISTRQVDKAINDLEEAKVLSEKAENQVEPDGIPNKLDQPLSNDQFNIWYHLGLAYYLNGRFDKALLSYIQCQEYSDNHDLKVATTYWQYLTYQKLGNAEQASKLISAFDSNIELIENEAYLSLLKLYKGELSSKILIGEATNENNLLNPTLSYGIGCYYQHRNEFDKANEIFLRVLESPHWDAFGYIASEAELTTIFPAL